MNRKSSWEVWFNHSPATISSPVIHERSSGGDTACISNTVDAFSDSDGKNSDGRPGIEEWISFSWKRREIFSPVLGCGRRSMRDSFQSFASSSSCNGCDMDCMMSKAEAQRWTLMRVLSSIPVGITQKWVFIFGISIWWILDGMRDSSKWWAQLELGALLARDATRCCPLFVLYLDSRREAAFFLSSIHDLLVSRDRHYNRRM